MASQGGFPRSQEKNVASSNSSNLKRAQNFDDGDSSAKRARSSWPHTNGNNSSHSSRSGANQQSRKETAHGLVSNDSLRPVLDVRIQPQDEWSQATRTIIQFYHTRKQSDELYASKMRLRNALYTVIKDVFPHSGLYMVGSSLNGFGSCTSDMDLCLMLSRYEIDQKKEAPEVLSILLRAFRKLSFLRNLLLIRAKVPILKFSDRISGLDCDLNINNQIGIRNTHLLSAYSQLDRRLCPLVLFVKHWAKFQNINDASQGTVSSYSLALMVIHYLQVGCRPPVLPSLQILYPQSFTMLNDVRELTLSDRLPPYTSLNTQSLGELFYGFLDYYTNQFDAEKYAISVRLGTRISRDVVMQQNPVQNPVSQWKHLCIEEPFDLSNTARSVFNPTIWQRVMRVVRRSFADMRQSRGVENIISTPM